MDTRCITYNGSKNEGEIFLLRQLVLGQPIRIDPERCYHNVRDDLDRLVAGGHAYLSVEGVRVREYRATPEAIERAHAEWARRRPAKELVPELPKTCRPRLSTKILREFPPIEWVQHRLLIAAQEPGGLTVNEDGEASSAFLTSQYVFRYCQLNHLRH